MSTTIQSSCCCFHRHFGTELTLTLKLEHSDPLTQRDHRCTKESEVVLDPNSAVPSTVCGAHKPQRCIGSFCGVLETGE